MLLPSLLKSGDQVYQKVIKQLYQKMLLLNLLITDIENHADDVYELFITKLFEEEKDCIELIKIKEIVYELEKTTDAAEHVGKILRSLIVKYA